ncbi:MAG TPA: phage minor head protein [Alphaproteobacteria bacterium]
MNLILSQPFTSSTSHASDVRQIKKILNRLGYYTPFETTGITSIPDQAVFVALKKFQIDHGLLATGEARPGDATVMTLSAKSEKTPFGSYVWRIVNDGRARKTHAQHANTVRNWADSPDPGEDFNCRCWAEKVESKKYIIDDPPLEPVYPELLLLPLSRVGRLYNIWTIWVNQKNTEWSLGQFKSPERWRNQLRNRDWTPEQITQTIKHGQKFPAPNKVNPANKAIRYEYKGRYLVRDEVTKEVLQLAKPNFERPIILER